VRRHGAVCKQGANAIPIEDINRASLVDFPKFWQLAAPLAFVFHRYTRNAHNRSHPRAGISA